FVTNNTNDDNVVASNILQKFDDEAFEPLDGSNENSALYCVSMSTASTKGELKVLYAAKPDKTGWISDEEMESTREEDLIYFESIDSLKDAGYICVGVLFENRNASKYPGANCYYGIKLKSKD